MLSETLSEGLKAYGIGAKVRTLRLKKSMGLVELGEHTGFTTVKLQKSVPSFAIRSRCGV